MMCASGEESIRGLYALRALFLLTLPKLHHRTAPDPDSALAHFCEYLASVSRLMKLTMRTGASADAYVRAFRRPPSLRAVVATSQIAFGAGTLRVRATRR